MDSMPFPLGSRAVLEDILVPPSPPPQPAVVQPFPRPTQPLELHVDDQRDNSVDDDYWNAYGSTDIGDGHYSQSAPASAKDAMSSEDAYWAQYASVQGKLRYIVVSSAPFFVCDKTFRRASRQ